MDSRTNPWSFFTKTTTKEGKNYKADWSISGGILSAIAASSLGHAGDITIGKLLGKGTSFTVSSCTRNDPGWEGTAVAIKIPKIRQKEDAQHVARTIHTELQLMAYDPLREDANIVQIMGYRWFPFELYPSIMVAAAHLGTLDEYLRTRGTFVGDDWNECHRLCLDVALALTSVHAEGITHGDVKPQNVLVYYSAGPNDPESIITAQLSDFSHSNFDAGQDDGPSLGTPLFSAPEVLARFYDTSDTSTATKEDLPKSDVWSFGLLAWCLVRCQASYFQDDWLVPPYDRPPRRVPFLQSRQPSFLQSLAAGMMADSEKWIDMPPNLRKAFETLLQGCLESVPRKRFAMSESSKLLDLDR